MRRGHIRRFVAPYGRGAKGRLETDKSKPCSGEFCWQRTRAVLSPCLPCHASNQHYDCKSNKPVSHLEPDLKRRDWVELLRAQPLRIDLLQKRRIHWRPDFSVGEGKIGHRKSSMLMAHSGAKDQLEEKQAGTADCQPIQARRNVSPSK